MKAPTFDEVRYLYVSVRPLVARIRAALGVPLHRARWRGAETMHLTNGRIVVRVLR